MGILANLERRALIENPKYSVSDPRVMSEIFGVTPTASGPVVNETAAQNIDAVFACVRVLTDTLGSLPCPVYTHLQPRGREPVPDHPVHRVLNVKPNPIMNPFVFREVMQAHVALWGAAYAEIVKDRQGRLTGLWPLAPWKVTAKRTGDRVEYRVDTNQGMVTLPADRVLHIQGWSTDGIRRTSVVGLARETLGLALSTERFGGRFFSNGTRPGGVVEHPGALSDKARTELRQALEHWHQGADNAHRIAVLEEGMKWHTIGVPPEDAQFLETRKFTVRQIARWFRMQPHKIGDLDNATFSNIEQQSIEHVTDTITPWTARWESAINDQLFTEREQRDGLFVRFKLQALVRGDIQGRFAAYAVGRQNGWLSANDVRELEDQNPIEGGDVYWAPVNMIPADEFAAGGGDDDPFSVDDTGADDDPFRVRVMTPDATTASDVPVIMTRVDARVDDHAVLVRRARLTRLAQARQRMQRAHVKVMRTAVAGLVGREIIQGRKALQRNRRRNLATFVEWIDQFYGQFGRDIVDRLHPVLMAYAATMVEHVAEETGRDITMDDPMERFVTSVAQSIATRWVKSSQNQLRKIIDVTDPDETLAALEIRLGEWEATRADKVAERESFQAGNAFVRTAFVAAGITTLVWRSIGGNCPLCDEMDGRVVASSGQFLNKGDKVDPGGDTAPLTTRRAVAHPPLHDGCDCQLTSEG